MPESCILIGKAQSVPDVVLLELCVLTDLAMFFTDPSAEHYGHYFVRIMIFDRLSTLCHGCLILSVTDSLAVGIFHAVQTILLHLLWTVLCLVLA